jgi:hypothetical protein
MPQKFEISIQYNLSNLNGHYENVKQDICQMKVKNWITCVQDRGKWKDVVEKTLTFKS